MPEIQEIETHYSRKVQLEQFEPVEHGVTLYAELAEGEDADEAYDELADMAEDMCERALAKRITQTKLADDEGDE